MKRTMSTLVCALILAVGACQTVTEPDPAGAVSASSDASGPSATGSGHVPAGSGQRVFTFHAVEHPDGTVSGSYRINLTDPSLWFSTDVTCLTVVGNTAWVGGIISATNAPFVQVGSVSYFYAIDDGEGAGTQDIVSTARFNDVAGEDLRFCEERPLLLAPLTIESGNVQVR